VNYLFWSGSSPLIFVILFSVLLGGILATIVGSRKYIQLKRKNRQLNKRVLELESRSDVADIVEPEQIESNEGENRK